jgi:hypothetical protein
MIAGLFIDGPVLAVAACARAVRAPAQEAPADVTASRDIVHSAAIHAYPKAKFRHDKRSVTLLSVPRASVTNAEVAGRIAITQAGIAADGK